MTRFARRAMLGLMIASMTAQATAQAEPKPAPRTVWGLAWESPYCKISTGDPNTLGLALWMIPGSVGPDLYVIGSKTTVPDFNGKAATLSLDADGDRFKAEALQYPDRSDKRVVVINLSDRGHEFLPAFGKARELRLAMSDKSITIPIKGSSKAVAALDQCMRAKLPEWGMDPLALSALREPPNAADDKSWIGADDYPMDALIKGSTGIVVPRFTVDATGKVTECKVVASSGSSSLDKVTCKAALERARFSPAIGADGRPVAATITTGIKFAISN